MTSQRLINSYSGRGKLVFSDTQEAEVNYQIDEFQGFVPDGGGGQIPAFIDRRGRVSHAIGHPAWHPIVAVFPREPVTLVMDDGRRLKVILRDLEGTVNGTGEFF